MRWLLVAIVLGLGVSSAEAARQTARSATCQQMAAHPWEPGMKGRGYEWGKVPDVEAAIDICRLALEELPAEPTILYRLARSLMQVERYDEAMPLMLSSAEAGYAPAETAYGTALLNGKGLPQDKVAASEWLERAVAQRHAIAQNNLGTMYWANGGLPRNDREAMRLFRLAADQGYALAQANLGIHYRYAMGTEYNPVEAQRLFEMSAALADPVGRTQLAELLLQAPGVARDTPRAITLLTQASIDGNSFAHHLLGHAYQDGNGVDRDPFAALAHLERADATGDAEAAYHISFLYGADDGVGRNDAKARDYMLKAAEGDFPAAVYHVGRTYYYGLGVDPDPAKAEYWLARAARIGLPQAQYLYADMLLRKNQPELIKKALEYAERAGYGGEGMGFILLVEHYLDLEQWDRAHGYAALALQMPDESVQNMARKAFELTEPHIRRRPTAMDAELG